MLFALDYTAEMQPLIVGFGALFLVVLALIIFAALTARPFVSDDGPTKAFQAGLGTIVLGLLAANVFSIGALKIDQLSLTLIGLLLAIFFLPIVENIEIPGVKLKTRAVEKARESIADYKEAVSDLTKLLASWTYSSAHLTYRLREAASSDRCKLILANYFRDRLAELQRWLNTTEEAVGCRISVWLFDQAKGKLVFYFSNEIKDPATREKTFAVGEGMLGQAFDEERKWNEPHATLSPSHEVLDGRAPSYQGILLVPIRFFRDTLGMIRIDRQDGARFSDDAVRLVDATAHFAGLALLAYDAAAERMSKQGEHSRSLIGHDR